MLEADRRRLVETRAVRPHLIALAAAQRPARPLADIGGRIMIIATHNTDNGDGWEREGENDWFFHEFSEKRAFPLGINIIFYSMTH